MTTHQTPMIKLPSPCLRASWSIFFCSPSHPALKCRNVSPVPLPLRLVLRLGSRASRTSDRSNRQLRVLNDRGPPRQVHQPLRSPPQLPRESSRQSLPRLRQRAWWYTIWREDSPCDLQ